MYRQSTNPRKDWVLLAEEFGFKYHTMHGMPYWDESAYYQFTLSKIEHDLEDPTEEVHKLCLEAVHEVVNDEELLQKFRIPEPFWDLVRNSWRKNDPGLYSRLDFAYDGNGPAKLFENNADTPTSVYETGFWQWLWLEQKMKLGEIPQVSDQFNSLQDELINRFQEMNNKPGSEILYFSCCKNTDEDFGTVEYLQSCAMEAGILTKFIYIEDIGLGEGDVFTDLDDNVIKWMFKLYPWEFIFSDEYSKYIESAQVNWLEPPWKIILSNKALLPMLWKMYPGHPNLLPAFFEDEYNGSLSKAVKKPIYSREGANIQILNKGKI